MAQAVNYSGLPRYRTCVHLLNNILKNLVKRALERLGLDLRRSPAYGACLFRDVYRILRPHRPEVILDVGANIGQSAAEFLREFPEAVVHSFEPNPVAFQQLVSTVGGNPRALPHASALGARVGHAEMHLTQSSLTSSLLATSKSAADFLGELVNPAGRIEVTVDTLDHFAETCGIQHVDLLKVDVQGYEIELLKGAARMLREHRIALVAIEVNFVQLYEGQAFFEEVYTTLKQEDFRMVGLYHADYRAGPYMTWGDALFVNLEATRRRRLLSSSRVR